MVTSAPTCEGYWSISHQLAIPYSWILDFYIQMHLETLNIWMRGLTSSTIITEFQYINTIVGETDRYGIWSKARMVILKLWVCIPMLEIKL